jgi:integrase/recombinase XerD
MLNADYTAIHGQYVLWLRTLGFSAETVNDYRKHVKSFLAWLQLHGVDHITALRQQHLAGYIDHQQTRTNKSRPGTVSVSQLNHSFAAVDKLLEFLHQMGLHSAPSPSNHRLKVDKQERINKIAPFTHAEIQALQESIAGTYQGLPHAEREAKQEQLKLVFALYYGCGLRRTEGYRLTVHDIDFDRRTVFVKQGKG